jgi:glycerol-3-phosphate dehydrogenase
VSADQSRPIDVLIIGAGVIGCALARELSRLNLHIAVLDQQHDVGDGVSKANSAILHTGFDAPAGSLEARLVCEGRRMWTDASPSLHVPIRRTGALVVAFTDADAARLSTLHAAGLRNGVSDLRMLARSEALALEPYLSAETRAALLVPGESITDPFAAVFALAEHAAINGAEFHLGSRVTRIEWSASAYDVTAGAAVFRTRWVINAAGLYSDEVAGMSGRSDVRVKPRKGEFLIFDKPASALVSHILLPVPSKISKGILVAPTIFGNVLAGPTASDQDDKDDHDVTTEGLARVRQGAVRTLPLLEDHQVIATYAGLRAVGSMSDYFVDVDRDKQLVTLSGIRSTGLTSALALARHVVSTMIEAGLSDALNPRFQEQRPKPVWVAGERKPCFDPKAVSDDPTLGRVVCLCERASEGEVVRALRAPVPARTLDAVKKRTWATAGRCQGYFCTAALIEILSRELGIPPWEVTKRGPGSYVVVGAVNGAERSAHARPTS